MVMTPAQTAMSAAGSHTWSKLTPDGNDLGASKPETKTLRLARVHASLCALVSVVSEGWWLQGNAAMSMGRSVHPAFQRRQVAEEAQASAPSKPWAAAPLLPPLPPIHVTQVLHGALLHARLQGSKLAAVLLRQAEIVGAAGCSALCTCVKAPCLVRAAECTAEESAEAA